MKHNKRRCGRRALLRAMACLAVALPAWAGATTLKLVTAEPQSGDAQTTAMKWFADQLKQRTGGQYELNILWGGSAAGPQEIPDAVSSGIATFGDLITPYFPDKYLLNNVIGYYVPQPKSMMQISDSLRAWRKKYPQFEQEMAKTDLKIIGYIPLAPYGFLCKEPIKTLADFKGKRIRSYGFAYPALIKAIGAAPVSLSTSDAYDALQRGVIDCTPISESLAHGWKYDEVAHNFVQFPIGASFGHLLVMNRTKFESLDPKTQKTLVELGKAFDKQYVQDVKKATRETEAAWKKSGDVKIVPFKLTEAQRDKIINDAGVQEVRNKWISGAKARGVPAKAIISELSFH